MGTTRSFNKCKPNFGYTFKTLLMYAVAMDLDFLEDVATNSTSLRALHNLRRVGMLMDRGYDDGVSDSGSNIRYTAAERYKYLKSLK